MDTDVKIAIDLLQKRISNAEKEIRVCHEGIRACKVAIHHLNKELGILAETVNTNTETLDTLADTQQKILIIAKNHQVAISNLIKSPKARKKFNDVEKKIKKVYIS